MARPGSPASASRRPRSGDEPVHRTLPSRTRCTQYMRESSIDAALAHAQAPAHRHDLAVRPDAEPDRVHVHAARRRLLHVRAVVGGGAEDALLGRVGAPLGVLGRPGEDAGQALAVVVGPHREHDRLVLRRSPPR